MRMSQRCLASGLHLTVLVLLQGTLNGECGKFSSTPAGFCMAGTPCHALKAACSRRRAPPCGYRMQGSSEEGTGEPELIDWRHFRARLVLQETQETHRAPAAPNSAEVGPAESDEAVFWAYNTKGFLEVGSFLLWRSMVEGDRLSVGLHLQYLHRAVVLLLSLRNGMATGVVVNRRTNQLTAKGWPIWYGGEVKPTSEQGLNSRLMCLHTVDSVASRSVSTSIAPELLVCPLEAAGTFP